MNLSGLFSSLWTLFKTQELQAVLPQLAAALTAYSTNPTAINGLAQLTKLQAEILAAQPNILQAEIAAIAAAVNSAAQELATTSKPT